MIGAALVALSACLALLYLPPGLPACLLHLPPILPGPLLLALVLGGTRAAVVVLVICRVLSAAGAGVVAVLPEELSRADVLVTGTVADFPRSAPGRVQFPLDVAATDGRVPHLRRILVNWYEPAGRVPAPGEHWQLLLRLKPPRGLSNPGGFDYERWLFAQRFDATAYVREDGRNRVVPHPRGGPGMLLRARRFLAEGITAAVPGNPALPYLVGLSVGVQQALPESEWELLRRTGTIHLISISGFHLTLVAAPLALLGALAGAWLAAGGLPVTPRVIGALVAMAGATLYGGLAGYPVPTLRSLLMIMAGATLVVARRRLPAGDVLAVAALAAIGLEPLGLLTPGFWLSFGGVAALVGAFQGLVPDGPTALAPSGSVPMSGQRVLAGLRDGRGIRAIRLLGLAQLATTVALLPLSVAWFGQVSVVGALANLVAIPAFSFVILPLVLAGTLLVAVAPGLATPVLQLAAAAVGLFGKVNGWFASLPFAAADLPEVGPLGVSAALVGAVLALWPRPFAGRWLAPACLLPLLLGGAVRPATGSFDLTVLDVGQGLAVVVRTARHTLLYDAGPAWRGGDAGERAVVPALRSLRVRRLDRVLVSHGDSDHYGGAPAVLAGHPEAELLASQWPVAEVPGRRECAAGEGWAWDGIRFRILHPPQDGQRRGKNDTSCVLAIEGPGGSALLTGDIESAAEAELLAAGITGPTDLVLAPHHGSRTSSSPAFVAALRPRFVIFPVGYANRWGFPKDDVVRRWQEAGSCALSPATAGAVRFLASPAAGVVLVRAERQAARRLWNRPAEVPACATRVAGRGEGQGEPVLYSGAGLVVP
jgi:competence protein ComEC